MEVGWVAIHFENCGLLVKRFTDPIRISITRLGDYNIISIHQLDNIDGLLSLPLAHRLIGDSIFLARNAATDTTLLVFSRQFLEFMSSYDAKIKVAIRSFRGISKPKLLSKRFFWRSRSLVPRVPLWDILNFAHDRFSETCQ